MGNLALKGHISYATKRKYKWVAEFGKNTCEKCAALHGQEFEEDEVPYWPHPNCRCKVEEISIVDEIDAELDEYKEDVKKGIAEQKEKAVRQEKQEKIIRQIVENAEMDIPDPMVVTQTRQMMDQFAQQMQSNGLSMAQYYQFTGLTPDGLLEQMKPQAQKNIENRLVLEAIAAAEGITASEEEVEKEFANIAERYGLTVDKVKEIFADEETENIKSDIAAQKALDMITEAAVEVPVTEVEATVEDAE